MIDHGVYLTIKFEKYLWLLGSPELMVLKKVHYLVLGIDI